MGQVDLSIGKIRSFEPIRDEPENYHGYITIQGMKFNVMLIAVKNVDEDGATFMVPVHDPRGYYEKITALNDKEYLNPIAIKGLPHIYLMAVFPCVYEDKIDIDEYAKKRGASSR